MELTVPQSIEYIDRIELENAQKDSMMMAIVSTPHTKKPKEMQNKMQERLRKLESKFKPRKEEANKQDIVNLLMAVGSKKKANEVLKKWQD